MSGENTFFLFAYDIRSTTTLAKILFGMDKKVFPSALVWDLDDNHRLLSVTGVPVLL